MLKACHEGVAYVCPNVFHPPPALLFKKPSTPGLCEITPCPILTPTTGNPGCSLSLDFVPFRGQIENLGSDITTGPAEPLQTLFSVWQLE